MMGPRGAHHSRRGGACSPLPSIVILLLALLILAAPATAHDIALYTAVTEIRRDGSFAIEVYVHRGVIPEGFGAKAPPVAIGGLPFPEDAMRSEAHGILQEFEVRFDGKAVPWRASLVDPPIQAEFHLRLEGDVPTGAQSFSMRGNPGVDVGAASARLEGAESGTIEFLRFGGPLKPFPLGEAFVPKGAFATAIDFIGYGFTHILPMGLDHVLFVLGIFLLSTKLKPILLQVTAFTVAHTVTLGLSMAGVVRLPSGVVEPLIAISIAYVAVENLCTQEIRKSRVALVFAFGLLHGLGFAGALAQLGLPRGQRAVALFSFNFGVELGQLAVLLTAWLVLARPFGAKPWYRKRVVVPLSLGIAAVGLYWAVTRTFGS
jgi:hypothetical protein